MKKMKIWSMMMLMTMVLPMLVACGGDDNDVKTISKSELTGTWYSLEDGWVLVISNSTVTQYELWSSGGEYSLNSYTYTWNYTIDGNRIISDDGQVANVSINGNKMTVSAKGQSIAYTKYNGTPQQLIVELNSK